MTIWILIIAIVACIAFFALRDRSPSLPLGDGPVIALGDSLVYGYGATAGRDFVSLLSARIGEPIVNMGVSGDTTAGGLARVDEVVAREPRAVILLLGGNDFLRKVPRAQTFANLKSIIQKLQASGARVLLLGVRGGLLSDSADSDFKRLADETGVEYVPDVLDGLFGDSRYMSDSIHPNDAGYARVAERVYPALAKTLK